MVDTQQNATLRVGVIGLGFGGETHLKAYKKIPNVEVVALAGLEEARLHELGATYQVPNLYLHYQDLLARDDLDAISIGVPNFLHAPIALAAFEKGLHVLCEKPLARTASEAEQMVEAARRAGRVLYVVFNHRERGDFQVLKRYINEGKLGDIYYAKAYWMRRHGIPGAGSWFVNKEMAGGGPLIDLGVHVLDIALFLMGEPEVATVTASTYNHLGSMGRGVDPKALKSGAGNAYEVEDLATVFIRLKNGSTLLLESSWATHSNAGDDYGCTLYGTEGGAEVKVRNYSWEDTLHIYTDIAGVPADITPVVPRSLFLFHQAVVNQFVDIVTSGDWAAHDGSDGLRRARIIDACYASALQGREVVLEG